MSYDDLEYLLEMSGYNFDRSEFTEEIISIKEEIDSIGHVYSGFRHQNEDARSAALRFWNNQGLIEHFPYLARVSDKYLCSITSSCPSESSFSFLSHVMSKKRRRIKISLLRALCTLWIEFQMEPNMIIGVKTVSKLAKQSAQNTKLVRKLEYFTKFNMKGRIMQTHPRRLGNTGKNRFSVDQSTSNNHIEVNGKNL